MNRFPTIAASIAGMACAAKGIIAQRHGLSGTMNDTTAATNAMTGMPIVK
jgi:hypothetical protein